MEIYTVKDLNFTYPNAAFSALRGISLQIRAGEFVTLCGVSGCGKTTLLRHLKPALTPYGKRNGEILFEGKSLMETEEKEQAARIGFVLQNPENQIVADKVWHELAFGLESLGMDSDTIRTRVAEMANFFGIQNWFHKNTDELSGGQKQLLNLAAIMVMQPDVLILDEPTAQLDPIAAGEFLQTIYKINRELGVAVLLSEHRLEEVFALSDRILVMEAGRLVLDCPPREIGKNLDKLPVPLLRSLPAAVQAYAALPNERECPISVREGRKWFDDAYDGSAVETAARAQQAEPVLSVKDGWFRYEKNGTDILKGFSFTLRQGECYALLGGNGAGKTTALSVLGGLQKLYRGNVRLEGKLLNRESAVRAIGILPQNPQTLFVKSTVEADLSEVFKGMDISKEERAARVQRTAEQCGIQELLMRHPGDLSGGEQQRAALAKVLLRQPRILLLDEPTKGMDGAFKARFGELLRELLRHGVSILVVSHDVEFCAEFADRCGLFFDGGIVSEGETHRFFSGNSFYTTAVNRMVRHRLPQIVTVREMIAAIGGKEKYDPPQETGGQRKECLPQSGKGAFVPPVQEAEKKISFRRTTLSVIIVLLIIPATIWMGMTFLQDRKYYFISLLVLAEIMLPFFGRFERRGPRAREVVTLAVLCGVAVAGRAALAAVPQVKPALAIIIIAGMCFGAESGFLVGAMTGFVSNFFFGQGMWTPWQMFAFGIVGFAAGLFAHAGTFSKKRIPLSLFGGAAAVLLYGGVMNLYTLLTASAEITWAQILLVYGTGVWFDLLHAVSTAVFLFFLAPPLIENLERFKTKYHVRA